MVGLRRVWEGSLELSAHLDREHEALQAGEPAVLAGRMRGPAVSVGVSERIRPELEAECRKLDLPLLRRSTGGTGVLHHRGDLVWSLVLPRTHPAVGPDFVRAYERLGGPVRDALRSSGIEAAWTGPLARSDRFCLLGPRGQVLTVGGRALGGAAQHATGRALLHHGIVVERPARPLLAALFGVPPEVLERSCTGCLEERPGTDLETIGRSLLEQSARWVPGADRPNPVEEPPPG